MLEHYLKLPGRYYDKDHWYAFEPEFDAVSKDASVIYLGCGRGSALLEFKRGVGIDFNPNLVPLWHTQGIADRCWTAPVEEGLAWEDWHFDWTMSVDFLEHLQPDAVDAALYEIMRLAPAGVHIIDLKGESAYRGPNGENLHPSANDAEFWENAFVQARRTAGLNPDLLAFKLVRRDRFLSVRWPVAADQAELSAGRNALGLPRESSLDAAHDI
jgi:hypothetical protein